MSSKIRLTILCALLAACGRESFVPAVKKSAVVRPPQPRLDLGTDAYYTGTGAADAVQKIRERVGEPFRVLEIRISEHGVKVKAQDPKKPENVDEYRYHGGKVADPIPVRLFGASDPATLKANLFDPADVDLTTVPALIKEAREKIQLEGGQMTGVSIERHLPFDRAVRIDVNFHGTRKNGYLRADRHGKNAKVRVF